MSTRSLWDEVERWLAHDYTPDELIDLLSDPWTDDARRLFRMVETVDGDMNGSRMLADGLYVTPGALRDAIARLQESL